MKRKLLTLLCGCFVAVSLFAVTGNTVKAEEPDVPGEDCTCHDLMPLSGAERNKIVANFISSEVFKAKKLELLKSGSMWNGAHTIEVVIPEEGVTMIGVPFVSNGVPEVQVFINGISVGTSPAE